MSSEPRAFSLIETMVAGVMLSLMAAALLSTMSYAASESARTRMRGIAATDANAQIERIIGLFQTASVSGASDAERCALLTAPSGPFDVAGGGTLSGTCPFLSASNIPVQGTAMRRSIQLIDEDLGDNHPGLHVRIVLSGPLLLTPLDFDTHVRR